MPASSFDPKIQVLVDRLDALPNWPYLASLMGLSESFGSFTLLLGRSRATKSAVKKLGLGPSESSALSAVTLYTSVNGNTHALFGISNSKKLPVHIHLSKTSLSAITEKMTALGQRFELLSARLDRVQVFNRKAPPADWRSDLQGALNETIFPPPRQFRSCVKSYPTCCWGCPLIKCRDYMVFRVVD